MWDRRARAAAQGNPFNSNRRLQCAKRKVGNMRDRRARAAAQGNPFRPHSDRGVWSQKSLDLDYGRARARHRARQSIREFGLLDLLPRGAEFWTTGKTRGFSPVWPTRHAMVLRISLT